MKFPFLVMFVILLLVALTACQMTPTQQYTLDKTAYNGVAIGLAIANDNKPFKPNVWALIQKNEAIARQNLADAQAWLSNNPQFANTPGMSCPSLDPFSVTLSVLSGYVPGGTVLVP